MPCCSRRRRGVPAPGQPGHEMVEPESDFEFDEAWAFGGLDHDPGQAPGGNKWQRLVAKIQSGRRWSIQGTAMHYAKHGMPRNLDGPARGPWRHLGRWGWREIASSW